MTRDARVAWEAFITKTKVDARAFLHRENDLETKVVGTATLKLLDMIEDTLQFITFPLLIAVVERQLAVMKEQQELIERHGDFSPPTIEELLEERQRQLEVRDPEEDEGDGDVIPPPFEVH